MQVYFSHSYRDVALNGYFLEQFVEEDIPLQADQKTDVWCVAKLERYLNEMAGFLSIIPRRPTDSDPGAYSPYIAHELNLARRAGEIGGTLPAVMNAANEVAVAAFLNRQIRFPQIWQSVAKVMDRHDTVAHPDLDAILAADQWARAEATAAIGKK